MKHKFTLDKTSIYEVKDIKKLRSELYLNAFALLNYFGTEGKIKDFSEKQIKDENDSLLVVSDFIEKAKMLCSLKGISDKEIIRIQKLTFAILNSILSSFDSVAIYDLYGKYVQHIESLTKLIAGEDLETERCLISPAIKVDYLVKLLQSAEKASVNGLNDENYKLSTRIINQTMREIFLWKYGKKVRHQLLKGRCKDDVKEVLSYQKCNKKMNYECSTLNIRNIILENILN